MAGVASCTSASLETPVPMDNVGRKLLEKMGWTGGGIGRYETGITSPVDVRQNSWRKGLGFRKAAAAMGSSRRCERPPKCKITGDKGDQQRKDRGCTCINKTPVTARGVAKTARRQRRRKKRNRRTCLEKWIADFLTDYAAAAHQKDLIFSQAFNRREHGVIRDKCQQLNLLHKTVRLWGKRCTVVCPQGSSFVSVACTAEIFSILAVANEDDNVMIVDPAQHNCPCLQASLLQNPCAWPLVGQQAQVPHYLQHTVPYFCQPPYNESYDPYFTCQSSVLVTSSSQTTVMAMPQSVYEISDVSNFVPQYHAFYQLYQAPVFEYYVLPQTWGVEQPVLSTSGTIDMTFGELVSGEQQPQEPVHSAHDYASQRSGKIQKSKRFKRTAKAKPYDHPPPITKAAKNHVCKAKAAKNHLCKVSVKEDKAQNPKRTESGEMQGTSPKNTDEVILSDSDQIPAADTAVKKRDNTQEISAESTKKQKKKKSAAVRGVRTCLEQWIVDFLTDYAASSCQQDLIFSQAFSSHEREVIHNTSNRLNLQHKTKANHKGCIVVVCSQLSSFVPAACKLELDHILASAAENDSIMIIDPVQHDCPCQRAQQKLERYKRTGQAKPCERPSPNTTTAEKAVNTKVRDAGVQTSVCSTNVYASERCGKVQKSERSLVVVTRGTQTPVPQSVPEVYPSHIGHPVMSRSGAPATKTETVFNRELGSVVQKSTHSANAHASERCGKVQKSERLKRSTQTKPYHRPRPKFNTCIFKRQR